MSRAGSTPDASGLGPQATQLEGLPGESRAAHECAAQAQLAIAWLLARPSITAPIASATNLGQLHDLIGALSLKLDQAAIEQLNQASAYEVAVSNGR